MDSCLWQRRQRIEHTTCGTCCKKKDVSDKANACATAVKERALASKNFAISFVSGTGGTHEKSS